MRREKLVAIIIAILVISGISYFVYAKTTTDTCVLPVEENLVLDDYNGAVVAGSEVLRVLDRIKKDPSDIEKVTVNSSTYAPEEIDLSNMKDKSLPQYVAPDSKYDCEITYNGNDTANVAFIMNYHHR